VQPVRRAGAGVTGRDRGLLLVTFPLTAKLEVNGPNRHPLYDELTATPDADGNAGDVQWNFEKFLVARDGSVTRFRPTVTPDDPAFVAAIEDAL
jgi:glutathione peroxidase